MRELYGLHQVLWPLWPSASPSVKQKHAQACSAFRDGPQWFRGQDAFTDAGSYGTNGLCIECLVEGILFTPFYFTFSRPVKWVLSFLRMRSLCFCGTQGLVWVLMATQHWKYPSAFRIFFPSSGPCYHLQTGLSSKSPWKLHPKDDKRHSLSYLDFTRDVTFSVIRNFLNLSRAREGELLQSLQSWPCHHLDERSYQSLCQLPFKAYKTSRILLSFSLDHFPSQISSSPYFKRYTLPITFSTAQQKVPINQHPWSQPCLRGRQPDCLLKQVTIVYQ